MKTFLISFGLCVFLFLSNTLGQENRTGETENRVPELENFHKVIYKIWHQAYPSKDCQALRELTEQVNKAAGKIYSAKLPGILRDKERSWKTGIESFKNSVEVYDSLSKQNNNMALLNAAENLHSNFEMLVKIIRPSSKEVHAFHQTLYIVYHKYLPEKDYEAIFKSAKVMEEQAAAITKAELPNRLKTKEEIYSEASAQLLSAVKELNSLKINDGNAIEKAVNKVHSKYQKIEGLF